MADQALPSNASPETAAESPLPRALARDKTPPWVVLVCADLGYSSAAPEPLLIAEWNEFLAAHEVVLRGTVLAGERVSLMNHRVSSLHDLRPMEIACSLPHLIGPVALRRTLSGLVDGTVSREEAHERLLLHVADDDLTASALDLLRDSGTGDSSSLPTGALAEIRNRVDALLEEEANRCSHMPFVSSRRGAWLALRELAAAVRRSSTVTLLVCSESRDRMLEHVQGVFDACAVERLSPDLVLWDYPVRFTMPQMKQLAHLLTAAEAHQTMVLAPIADDEPLVTAMGSAESIRPMVADEEYIPFRRLRRNPAARCLGLCGPAALLSSEESAEPVHVTAPWLLAQDMVRLIMDGASPLDVAVPSGEDMERNFQYNLPEGNAITLESASEAAESGLIVLSGSSASGPRLPLTSFADRDVSGEAAGHFGYNLLLNRAERLCRQRLDDNRDGALGADRVADLRQFLLGQLSPYRVLSSERGVRVSDSGNGELTVDVDIDRTLGDFPMRFTLNA